MPANDPSDIGLEVPGFTRDQWLEAVAGYMPGGGDVFSWENSEAITMGYVPFDVRRPLVRAVLGYSYVDHATFSLKRIMPLFHPEYPYLVCQGVHLQPRCPYPFPNFKIPSPNPILTFDEARYYQTEVTLRFRPVLWEYKLDAQVTHEYERFTYDEDRVGNLEIASYSQGNRRTYAEGPAGNPQGNTIETDEGLPIVKEQLNFVWEQVPVGFVVSGTTPSQFGLPARKILPRLGTVNDATFLGYAAGTLLFMGVRFQRYLMPLRYVTDPNFYYRITFNFQGFDPEKGVPASSFRGHNLAPFKGDTKFYYATFGGATGDAPLLRATDFTKLFEHVDKP